MDDLEVKPTIFGNMHISPVVPGSPPPPSTPSLRQGATLRSLDESTWKAKAKASVTNGTKSSVCLVGRKTMWERGVQQGVRR